MDNPSIDGVGPEGDSSAPPKDSPHKSDLIPQEPPSIERKEETTYCKPDQTPFWKMLIETAAVFVGLYVASIYHGQLSVMQGQLGEIIRQFPEIQKSANAATSANIAAHDALTRSNRPWLGVESLRVTAPIGFTKAGSGKDITYFISGSLEITIKNFGSSPALSVRNFIEAYDPTFLNETFDPSDPFAPLRKFGEGACALADGNEFTKKNPRMYGGSIFPTQTTTYTSYGIPGFAKRELAAGDFMQLVGCISYRDQFRETTHHTHYCVLAPIGTLGTVNNCESNTDAD